MYVTKGGGSNMSYVESIVDGALWDNFFYQIFWGQNVNSIELPPKQQEPEGRRGSAEWRARVPTARTATAAGRRTTPTGSRGRSREAIQKKKFGLEFRLEKQIEIPF